MIASLLVALVVAAVDALLGPLRRRRTVRRLERAESEVAEAVEGGRLARPTGEALLQHLEGLRRSIVGGREG
jgi:hypothetical protein